MADTFLFVRIALFAAAVPLLTRLPIRRLQKLVEPTRAPRLPDPVRVAKIIQCTDRFCRLARPLIARRCMTRGLTLYYFLRRAGVDSSLVFGVGHDLKNFTGHCWLVRNGEPYLEKTDPRPFFTPVHSFNASRIEYHSPERIGNVRG